MDPLNGVTSPALRRYQFAPELHEALMELSWSVLEERFAWRNMVKRNSHHNELVRLLVVEEMERSKTVPD